MTEFEGFNKWRADVHRQNKLASLRNYIMHAEYMLHNACDGPLDPDHRYWEQRIAELTAQLMDL